MQREVLAQMLRLYGFEVEIAEDGRQGVEKAVSIQPDLILTDSRMPEMSGFEAVTVIRRTEATAKTPIIALSAMVDGLYRKQVLDAGVNVVFSKPVDIDRLVRTIKALLSA